MTGSERVRVLEALDLIRDVLKEYVDGAMVKAFGQQWDDHVSNENAKRRSDGRKFAVSKNDLAVQLKAIQFERIEPWASKRTYQRVRGYVGEILTVRNLVSHGDECVGELERLIDTATRMLQSLGLTVPQGLEASTLIQEAPASEPIVTALVGLTPTIEGVDGTAFPEELEPLGEAGLRASRIFVRAEMIGAEIKSILEPLILAGEAAERSSAVRGTFDLAAEAFELLEETYVLEEHDDLGSPMGQLLVRFARYALTEPLLQAAMLAYISQGLSEALGSGSGEGREDLGAAADKRAEADARLQRFDEITSERPRIELLREILALARSVPSSGSFAALVIVTSSMDVLRDESVTATESLQIVRDCVARCRLLATREPGSVYETYTAMFLRKEGKLYNDLDLPEEALKAFARADEIIDRFPTAEPELVFPGSTFADE